MDLYTEQIWPPDTVIELHVYPEEMLQQKDLPNALEFFAERLRALGAPVWVSEEKVMHFPAMAGSFFAPTSMHVAPAKLCASYGTVVIEVSQGIFVLRWTAS